ncbi:MAG: hypothetical protein BKP49_09635 [Treponema sp. CETP13]|nr:MAG: hypothetical protein BKP49_09635 [Treponema sp. CETP13]
MKKLLFILASTMLFFSCKNYSDFSLYYASFSFTNYTIEPVNVTITASDQGDHDEQYYYSIIDTNTVEAETEKTYTLSWVPGEFTTVTINGEFDTDATINFLVTTTDEDGKELGKEEIEFPLISNSSGGLTFYETYAKSDYDGAEYQKIIEPFDLEDRISFSEYYYLISQDTPEAKKAAFKNLDALLLKYYTIDDLEKSYYFY